MEAKDCAMSILHYLTFSAVLLGIAFTPSCSHDTRERSIDRVGDTYEIQLERKSESSGASSSGSSTSRMTLMERVVELRSDGIVLEFDLPSDVSEEDGLETGSFLLGY